MKMKRLALLFFATALSASGLAIAFLAINQLFDPPARSAAAEKSAPAPDFGGSPISFEANHGQTDPQVDFLAQGPGYQLFLSSNDVTLLMENRSGKTLPRAVSLRMKLRGAIETEHGQGLQELAGRKNYLVGNDPAKWRRDIPLFAKIRYPEIYHGIDIVYYGNQRQMEYDFVLKPDADPAQIGLEFEGSHDLRVDEQGDLVIGFDMGELRFHRPVAYQSELEKKTPVEVAYQLVGDHSVRFRVGEYDTGRQLVIDPILSYSTFIGGSSGEGGNGIAVDSAGNAYIIGTSLSADYPVTAGAFSSASPGIIVTKLNPQGSALVYSTFVGGTAIGFGDEGLAIAVDSAGQATITGNTISRDFPTTANAFDQTCGTDGMCNQDLFGVNGDAFLTVFNAAGSNLVYSTFIGGTDLDFGRAVTIDRAGKTYVAGSTLSKDLPTRGAAQTRCGGGTFLPCADGYVAKFDTHLSGAASLIYMTYLGGKGDDIAQAVAGDKSGNAYVTGQTISLNFPTTAGALDTTCGDDGRCDDINSVSPGPDAFVTKINSSGSSLVYSTYLGANGWDIGAGIAVDNRGTAYVTGLTQSTDYPTTNGAFSKTLGGIEDAFVTLVNATGTGLTASTYLGGEGEDTGSGIAVDRSGNAYVVGTTDSPNFPTTPDRVFGFAGGEDAFVTKLESNLAILIHSTYLGGSQDDFGAGIALSRNATFVTGSTHSPGFPTTRSAFDRTCGTDGICNDDLNDVFVTRFVLPETATLFASAELSETFFDFGAVNVGMTSPPKVSILKSTGDAPLLITSIVATGDFAQTNDCPSSLAPGAQCSIGITFTPTATGGRVGKVTVTDNAANSPQIITLTGNGISNAKATLIPGDIDFGNVKIGTQSLPMTETVKSVGTSDLVITSVFVGQPFFQTNDCIGHPIPPGGQCTVSIVYKPTEVGGDFTIFQLTDNTSQFNAANITGNGVP